MLLSTNGTRLTFVQQLAVCPTLSTFPDRVYRDSTRCVTPPIRTRHPAAPRHHRHHHRRQVALCCVVCFFCAFFSFRLISLDNVTKLHAHTHTLTATSIVTRHVNVSNRDRSSTLRGFEGDATAGELGGFVSEIPVLIRFDSIQDKLIELITRLYAGVLFEYCDGSI
jgi:hypothetical protein